MGPFVNAVTTAVKNGSDNWEAEYYRGANNDRWSPRRLPTYMDSRTIALGPEWADGLRWIGRRKGELAYVYTATRRWMRDNFNQQGKTQ